VGTQTTKIVILKKGAIMAQEIVATRAAPEKAARQALDNALVAARLKPRKIKRCIGTGWGRKKIKFADRVSGEIPCLVRGARWFVPSARTIINAGSQSMTLISLNEKGKVLDHTVNDRCAAGTGKFIEVMAEALELELEEFGPLSLQAGKEINISSQCIVFAESEVINHINKGEQVADVISGITQSIVNSLVTMVNRIGLVEDVCLTGGVAKNTGVVTKLAEKLDTNIRQMPHDPQFVGALGAAIMAAES
jgi:predicted CoA-substrate-specific enzyme activase